LLGARDEYFAALRAYQVHGDPVPIIEAFASATRVACEGAERLAGQLSVLRAGWDSLQGRPRRGSIGYRLLQDLAEFPVVNAETVAERYDVDPSVARRGLAALTDLGVLHEASGKRRGRIWVAEEMVDLLDAFAAETARDAGEGRRVGPSRHLRS
jgi:hypothetical protein